MDVLRRSLPLSLAALPLLMLGACDIVTRPQEPPPTVQVLTDRPAYARGESGSVRLVNLSAEAVEYNLCRREVERREKGVWLLVLTDPAAGTVCAMEAYVLPAGASVMVPLGLPQSLSAGTYRVRYQAIHSGSGRSVPRDQRTTNPFDLLDALPPSPGVTRPAAPSGRG